MVHSRCRRNFKFSNTAANTMRSYLRIILVATLYAALLSYLNGCSSHQKPTPQSELLDYQETGIASYYARKFHSARTASGEIFKNQLLTAAHKTLPFGTNVLVKNLRNGKTVKVRINDRGPFVNKRIIDLSRAAFAKIENLERGLTKVKIMVVDE